MPPFVGGLWMDLFHLTGCDAQTRPGFAIAVNVGYKPDGRPARIATGDTNLPEPCLRFARVLFALSVAAEARPRPATFSDLVVLWFEPKALACADRAYPQDVESRRRRSAPGANAAPTLTRPKAIDEPPPFYTPEARRMRLEGDVLIRAELTPDGCFSQGTVAKSPSPLLSASALFAVLEWKYKPGLADGQPVPIDMNLTVRFTLPR